MKRHFQCAEQQVSLSNLAKYCACHEKWHCKISKKISKNRWNVISNAGPIRPWSDHDPSMIRAWSDHNPTMKPTVRNPPRNRGYFSNSPRAFSIEKYNVSRPILHSNIHQMLHLPPKVPLELHQILRLPRKVTLELHQVLRLPRKVTLELHQVLHLPRKVTLELHQVLRLPLYCNWTLLYSTLLDTTLLDSTLLDTILLDSTLLESTLLDTTLLGSTLLASILLDSTLLDLLYLILLYLTYSTWLYSTWLYSTWHYSTWHYSTWLYSTTLFYLTLLYLTLLYLTLLYLTLLYLTLLYLTLLYLTLLYLTLFYLTLLYLTLLDSTLLDSTLLDSTLLDSTLLDSTLLDSTLLDSTLLDSTLLDLTLLRCRSYIGSFWAKLPLMITTIYNKNKNKRALPKAAAAAPGRDLFWVEAQVFPMDNSQLQTTYPCQRRWRLVFFPPPARSQRWVGTWVYILALGIPFVKDSRVSSTPTMALEIWTVSSGRSLEWHCGLGRCLLGLHGSRSIGFRWVPLAKAGWKAGWEAHSSKNIWVEGESYGLLKVKIY